MSRCDRLRAAGTGKGVKVNGISPYAEGRAIQDVYIVPLPCGSTRQTDKLSKISRYRILLRGYDPATGVWHVT
jgi:hypothetical protein